MNFDSKRNCTFLNYTPYKTNMTIEKQPVEDVSPIKNGDFPSSHVSFRGCNDLASCHSFQPHVAQTEVI